MIHATRSQPADPTCREISALTIKMPEPTMMPETIMIESKSPSALRNSPVCSCPAFDSIKCTSALKCVISYPVVLLCELCYNLETTSPVRYDDGCVVVGSTQPTCFAVDCDTGHALALRRTEGDVKFLR